MLLDTGVAVLLSVKFQVEGRIFIAKTLGGNSRLNSQEVFTFTNSNSDIKSVNTEQGKN